MKIFKILSLLAASAMLGACATTEVSTEFAPGIKNGGKEHNNKDFGTGGK